MYIYKSIPKSLLLLGIDIANEVVAFGGINYLSGVPIIVMQWEWWDVKVVCDKCPLSTLRNRVFGFNIILFGYGLGPGLC